jgi:hypothetical protein
MQEETTTNAVIAATAAASEVVSWSTTDTNSSYGMVTMSLPSHNTVNEKESIVTTHEESSTHMITRHQEASFIGSTTMTNTLDSYSIYNPWENVVSPVTHPVVTISAADGNSDTAMNDEATSPLLLPQPKIDMDTNITTNPNAIDIPIIIDEASIIEDSAVSNIDTNEKENVLNRNEDISGLETEMASPVVANAQWQTSVSIATFEKNLAHIKQSADEADESEPLHDTTSFISGYVSSMASFHHDDDDDDDDEEVVITTDILERETAKALERETTVSINKLVIKYNNNNNYE